MVNDHQYREISLLGFNQDQRYGQLLFVSLLTPNLRPVDISGNDIEGLVKIFNLFLRLKGSNTCVERATTSLGKFLSHSSFTKTSLPCTEQ